MSTRRKLTGAVAALVLVLASGVSAQSPGPEYDGLYDQYMMWVSEAGSEFYMISDGSWKPPSFDRWIEENYSVWIEPTYEIWGWTEEGWLLEGYATAPEEPVPTDPVLLEPIPSYPALADTKYLTLAYGQSTLAMFTSVDLFVDGFRVEYYAFYGNAGDLVDLRMTSDEFDSYLRLTDEFGGWIGEDDDTLGGLDARLLATLPETGWYLIHATSLDPLALGRYSISVDLFAGIPSDMPMTPIAVGEKLDGSLNEADPIGVYRKGVEGFYALTLLAPQDLTVSLSSPDGSLDTYLFVTDSTGKKILFENDDFDGLDSLVSGTLEAGTYVIVVSTYDGAFGNYTLSIQPGLTESYEKDPLGEPLYEILVVRTATETFLGAMTGEQLLRLTVDPSGDWSTHGKYVAAVTKGVRDLIDSGRLTRDEGSRLIVEAARARIGKRLKPHERERVRDLRRPLTTLEFVGPRGTTLVPSGAVSIEDQWGRRSNGFPFTVR
ncbi:MAG: hypothetical protein HYY93_13570 [Planctomycetes bacterium]|nr:hypothetical protein [Planctomycetota bacterium]